MSVWIIEPHDPLIFRDGRPFGPTPGARAQSLTFPFPSTTTGGVRTQVGLNEEGIFAFNTDEQLAQLKKLEVRGPLLVQLAESADNQGRIAIQEWLFPAPADALILLPQPETQEQQPAIKQLVPLKPLAGAATDFDSRQPTPPLWLAGLPEGDARKPYKHAPTYWTEAQFLNWPHTPDDKCWHAMDMQQLGHDGPQSELRVHVAMDWATHTGKEGALFDTSGMEFSRMTGDNKDRRIRRLALAVIVDEQKTERPLLQPHTGPGSFGSERRIVSWRKSSSQALACPDKIKQAIVDRKACRLILLTPAYFKEGYRPTWLLTEEHAGVKPELKAIINKRPQVVSGWDIAQGKRKPTRRLAPAGTVLYLKFQADVKEADIEAWIKRIWMHCVSDNDQSDSKADPNQYRHDGFGLAVLGTWSGEAVAMQEGGHA